MSTAMDILLPNRCTSPYTSIVGYRLQPIIYLQSNDVYAYEVLSKVVPEVTDVESYFRSFTPIQALAVFYNQFYFAKRCLLKNKTIQYWLNLTVAVIATEFAVEELCSLSHEGKIAIEIQDPEELSHLNTLSRFLFLKGIRRLKKAGWGLILDDITEDLVDDIDSLGQMFRGIKVSRSELPTTGDRVKGFMKWITSLRSIAPIIVAEGIETELTRDKVVVAGADFGQGFFWPQHEYVLEISDFQIYADRLAAKIKKANINKVSVSFPVKDEAWTQGILLLISEVLHSDGKRWQLIITDENEADLIFRGSWCGLSPINCSRYRQDFDYRREVLQRKTILVYPGKDQLDQRLHCPAIAASITLEDSIKSLYATLSTVVRSSKARLYSREGTSIESDCSPLCHNQRLTARELDVIRKISDGMGYSAISELLKIDPKTVSNYKRAAMFKLGLKTNADLLSYINWRFVYPSR